MPSSPSPPPPPASVSRAGPGCRDVVQHAAPCPRGSCQGGGWQPQSAVQVRRHRTGHPGRRPAELALPVHCWAHAQAGVWCVWAAGFCMCVCMWACERVWAAHVCMWACERVNMHLCEVCGVCTWSRGVPLSPEFVCVWCLHIPPLLDNRLLPSRPQSALCSSPEATSMPPPALLSSNSPRCLLRWSCSW